MNEVCVCVHSASLRRVREVGVHYGNTMRIQRAAEWKGMTRYLGNVGEEGEAEGPVQLDTVVQKDVLW